jgi:hypothetical protein
MYWAALEMKCFFYRAPEGEPKALALDGLATTLVEVETVLDKFFVCIT